MKVTFYKGFILASEDGTVSARRNGKEIFTRDNEKECMSMIDNAIYAAIIDFNAVGTWQPSTR